MKDAEPDLEVVAALPTCCGRWSLQWANIWRCDGCGKWVKVVGGKEQQ